MRYHMHPSASSKTVESDNQQAARELLPCPWCGRAPVLTLEGVAGDGITEPFYVRCLRCNVKREAPTEEQVTALWNGREGMGAEHWAELHRLRVECVDSTSGKRWQELAAAEKVSRLTAERLLAEIVDNLSPGLPLNAKARHAVKQARAILAREEKK